MMATNFTQLIICLLAGITAIVLLTVRFKLHAFFALMIACFIVGIGVQMPFAEIIITMKDGFGNIMKSLGFIIVLGTTLGVLLEHTGSTKVMAGYILKIVGERNAAIAMSITGFIVGMPIFCDSAFIVLNGINKSVAKRANISLAVTTTSLAASLLAIHCLIPPHPGASSAASMINVDFGKLILTGIITALPAIFISNWWAKRASKNIEKIIVDEEITEASVHHPPSVIKSFLPVVVPILLIALKSFLSLEKSTTDG